VLTNTKKISCIKESFVREGGKIGRKRKGMNE